MTHLFTMSQPVCFNHRQETDIHFILSITTRLELQLFLKKYHHSPEETEEPDRLELLDAAIASYSMNIFAYWRL